MASADLPLEKFPLTKKQRRALRLVERLTFPRGPTIQELSNALGLTNRGGHDRMRALIRKGLVTNPRGRGRGSVLTAAGRRVLRG